MSEEMITITKKEYDKLIKGNTPSVFAVITNKDSYGIKKGTYVRYDDNGFYTDKLSEALLFTSFGDAMEVGDFNDNGIEEITQIN